MNHPEKGAEGLKILLHQVYTLIFNLCGYF